MKSMQKEINSLQKNDTYESVELKDKETLINK
jgi:hypothetical protein